MKILQKYITINLVWATLVTLFALVSLFSFFSIINQLEQTGQGNYNVFQVLLYVLLTVPRLAYELFPIAAVIGSMVTLGVLAQNSELAVIRTSGVSRLDLALLLSKSAMIIIIIAILIGEFVAPISEESAQQRRSIALSGQITMKAKHGYWTKDENSYINIRKVLPDNKVENVYIYEFDKQNRLRASLHARQGEYEDKLWHLKDVDQTRFVLDGVEIEHLQQASWESLLDPEMINYMVIKPQYLTLCGLTKHIEFLRENAQETIQHEQALWTKLVKPFSILAMVLLAVLLVDSNSRFTPVGHRVFFGAATGVLFHICSQTAGHMSIVYFIPPSVSVTIPTILLLTVISYFLCRQ